MQEQWSRWEPIEGLSPKYYIDSISDKADCFKVILFDGNNINKKLLIIFEKSVDSYELTDESYKLQLFRDLRIQYGASLYGRWAFFKISNSSYVQLISKESENSSKSQFIHFSIFTSSGIIDIIATYEPKVHYL